MASYPLGFRLAQAIGLTGAAWLAGKPFRCLFSAGCEVIHCRCYINQRSAESSRHMLIKYSVTPGQVTLVG